MTAPEDFKRFYCTGSNVSTRGGSKITATKSVSTSYRFTQAETHATTSIHHEAVLAGRKSFQQHRIRPALLSVQNRQQPTRCGINVLKNPATVSASLTGQRRPLFSGDLEGVWPRPSLKVQMTFFVEGTFGPVYAKMASFLKPTVFFRKSFRSEKSNAAVFKKCVFTRKGWKQLKVQQL